MKDEKKKLTTIAGQFPDHKAEDSSGGCSRTQNRGWNL